MAYISFRHVTLQERCSWILFVNFFLGIVHLRLRDEARRFMHSKVLLFIFYGFDSHQTEDSYGS